MSLLAIYANIRCSDLAVSAAWYETLLKRPADSAPMPGLLEWHHGDSAALQLFQEPSGAGQGTLTLKVTDLPGARARLNSLHPGEIEAADYVDLIRLRDPDGNLVVLFEART